jgi:REP element-mobilizing transposase RayT
MFGERPPRHRKHVRLPNFDYSQPGVYFVTSCSSGRRCIFGDVVDGQVQLSGLGALVRDRWLQIPLHHPGVETDAFVVMPNHIHGVLRIVEPSGTDGIARPRAGGPTPRSIGTIVGSFKAGVTRRHRRSGGPASSPIWQRGYHDHVIRIDHALDRVRQYIAANPANWPTDPDNPRRLRHGGATQASPLQDTASWGDDDPAREAP